MLSAWFRGLLAALLAATITVIGLSGPASAATYCRYDSCNGRKAVDMGCGADAYAVDGVRYVDPITNTPAEIDLWYSPACEAAWGEYVTNNYDEPQVVRLVTEGQYGGIAQEPFLLEQAAGDHDYQTTMVSWNNSVFFCAGEPGAPACTGWR